MIIQGCMGDWVPIFTDEEVKRERDKARELRASQWWKRRCSSGVCHYCGKKFPPRELTMDHLVPLIRGGRSTKGNVVPACKECNTRKKHQLAFEWEPEEQAARGDQPPAISKKADG
jgi:5-methylcytosine-specific restriction endonuclease McrA